MRVEFGRKSGENRNIIIIKSKKKTDQNVSVLYIYIIIEYYLVYCAFRVRHIDPYIHTYTRTLANFTYDDSDVSAEQIAQTHIDFSLVVGVTRTFYHHRRHRDDLY